MFIIYHTRAYARYLPRELGVTSDFPNHDRIYRRSNKMRADVNWGCGPNIINRSVDPSRVVLNRDISGSLRKLRTFELLRQAELPFPPMTTDATKDGFFMGGRYLGRKDGLSGGKGIVIYDGGQRPSSTHDFYARVISKVFEVRIHVGRMLDGDVRVLCEQIKYVPAGSNVLIRNFDNGARFSAVPLHTRVHPGDADRARALAVAALNACHMDFAAVDMALSKKGQWYIFELNSAPGLMRRDDNDHHEMPATYHAYLDYFRTLM